MPRCVGEVHGIPIQLLDIDAGRGTPLRVEKEMVRDPWPPASSATSQRPTPSQISDTDAYWDAQLWSDTLACLQADWHANAVWWERQLEVVHVQGPSPTPQLAKCVDQAEEATSPSDTPLVHQPCVHRQDQAQEMTWHDPISQRTFLLQMPPRSAALLTDLLPPATPRPRRPHGWEAIQSLVQSVGGADVVLLDPPWPNQSAARVHRYRRRHGYQTMPDLYDVWRIRPVMETLLPDDPLVAVWVTNHPKVQKFVRDKLFPGLGLVTVAVWAWLKVTAPTKGQAPDMVVPLGDGRVRKPYELLWIGAKHASMFHGPRRQILASIPLAHSVKPYVGDLLSQRRGAYVELFARHVSQGTTLHVSIGKEAVLGNIRPGHDDDDATQIR